MEKGMETMRAAIWTAYGPPEVLQIREIPRPEPKEDEILVRVVVSNVFPGDCELRRLDVKIPGPTVMRLLCGWKRPRRANAILGQEFAGIVVDTGFRPGDRVFGAVEPFVNGTYCEYLVTRGGAVTKMSGQLSFRDAAVLSVGGLNALHGSHCR